MTNKEKLHQILSSLWKNDDCVGKTYYNQALQDIQTAIDLQEEPVSEDLEEVANKYGKDTFVNECMENGVCDNYDLADAFKAGAKWQKKQDQSTIELAEDHAYFAGRTNTIDEIKETLLSEVLPYFMHGGEADEVVGKLEEVLNQKK